MLGIQEYRGIWWLPESDQQISGNLRFGPDQPVRLELLSGTGQDIIRLLPDLEDVVLWGMTAEGHAMTLFNCNQISCAFPGIGLQTAVYNAEFIVIGAHLKGVDSPAFDKATISIEGLDQWFGINGYQFKGDFDVSAYEISYLKPEDIAFNIDANTSIKISSQINYPQFDRTETVIRQENKIELEFREILSLDEVLTKTWKVQRFFSLLTQNTLRLRWYYLQSPLFKHVFSMSVGKPEINISLSLFFRQSATKIKDANALTKFLRFEVVKYKLETTLKRFFELDAELGAVIDILYANIGESNQYLQNIFLNLVQAVEAYHRITMQDTDQLKMENRERLDRLLSYLPEGDDKTWLEQKLAYSYEPGLRKRLKELFELNKMLIFSAPEPTNKLINRLIENIVNKRNYLTHLDGSSKNISLQPNILLIYNRVLKQLLTVLLLRSLGFEEDFLYGSIPLRSKCGLVRDKS